MIQANEKSAEADASHPVDSSALDAIRECHNEKDVTYWLPKDEKEQKRLKVVKKKKGSIKNSRIISLFPFFFFFWFISNTLLSKSYMKGTEK